MLDVAGGPEIASFTHTDTVRAVALSPDGTRLATGSSDGITQVLELK